MPSMQNTTKPPRVLMINPRFFPFVGGNEMQAWTLARALALEGAAVTVLTGRLQDTAAEETVDGVKIIRFPFSNSRLLRGVLFMPFLLLETIRRKQLFDIVHCQTYGWYLLVPALTRLLAGQPMMIKLPSTGSEGLHAIKERFFGHALQSIVLSANRIVAVSTAVFRDVVTSGYHRDQIVSIPNGVDCDAFHPVEFEEKAMIRKQLGISREPVAVYVGRISAEKGVSDLIEAWPSVCLVVPSAQLVIVGDGPERIELMERTKGLPIIWSGAVSNPAHYFNASDVFILPSRREGMSNALLEAMASGIASVASDVGGNRDVIDHGMNGFLYPSGNIATMAGLLANLLIDRDLNKRLGIKAREFAVSRYAIPVISRQYIKAYRDLLQNP